MIWIILTLSLILRIINLNQSLWLDEAISALAARDYSYVGIIRDFLPGDTHPPLYYLSLKFWANLFGFSEISLRSLSVIFGVLTVYVVYLIGKKMWKEKVGLAASSFLATAPLHIYYSQEVRMYSLSAFLVSFSIYSFLLLEKKVNKRNWILFSLSLLLVALVDYLPLLIIPVFWTYAISKKKNKAWWKTFLFFHAPLLLFAFIWFPVFYQQTLGSRAALISFPAWGQLLGNTNLKELLLVWVKFIIGRISISPKYLYALVVLASSIPFIYGFFKAYLKKEKVLVLWFWLIVPATVAFAGSFFVPGFSYFRLLFVLPAFYLLVGFGLMTSKYGKYLIPAVLLLNVFSSFYYIARQDFWREDWKGAVSFIEDRVGQDAAVLMAFPEPFAPYRWYSENPQNALGIKDFSDRSEEVVFKLQKEVADKSQAISLDYLSDVTDPGKAIIKGLESFGFEEKQVYNFRGVGQIRYWEK